MRIGVVLAGGASSQSTAEQLVPRAVSDAADGSDDVVIVVAADSGLDLARRLGIVPTLVVGDFDSATPVSVAWARQLGIELRVSPTDKDETDLDLALAAAIDAGAERLIVLGGAGGRLDHLLGNIGAIGRVGGHVDIEAWLGTEYLAVVTGVWRADLADGATISVLPLGDAAVVSEAGVRWPLDRHRLPLGSTQGISNTAIGDEPVVITVHEGRALVVVPSAKDLS